MPRRRRTFPWTLPLCITMSPLLRAQGQQPVASPLVAPRPTPDSAPQPPPAFMPFMTLCPDALRLNIFGDVYLAADRPAPTEALLAQVEPMLAWAHFNVVNLEGAVTSHPERAHPDFPFALRIHKATPALLASRNIRHVTRANNHSMDFGLQGKKDTDAALLKAGIVWTGVGDDVMEAQRPLVLERSGLRVGILAFTTTYPDAAWASESKPGVPYPTAERLRRAIGALRKDVDWIITVFHWGEERSPDLKAHQPELARIALEAGADAVVGHHAHIAQAVEEVEGKWAVYGLGNFLFHSNSTTARFGLGASFELCRPSAGVAANARMALIPLDTFNQRTDFATRFMTRELFDAAIAPYRTRKLVPPQTPFYLPGDAPLSALRDP